MFIDENLTKEEKIEYYIKLYEQSTNNNEKIVILEKINSINKESENNEL